MRKFATLIAGSLLLGGVAALADPPDREAELARALQGRVAEAPVDCIDMRRVRNTRIINGTAILYNTGNVIYVNRPDNGAESLRSWDQMHTRQFMSRLCSVDTVQMFDPNVHTLKGVVFLGEFVPYRRVRTSSAD